MKYMKLMTRERHAVLHRRGRVPSVTMKGTQAIHQEMFFDTYAGCFVKRYGPFVRMPRWVRFEKRTPNVIVART